MATKKSTKSKKNSKKPATPATPDIRAHVDTLVDLAVAGIYRYDGTGTDDEIGDLGGDLGDACDQVVALAEGLFPQLSQDRFPSRSDAFTARVQLEATGAQIVAAAMRVVALAGRLEGLCEARELAQRSAESAEAVLGKETPQARLNHVLEVAAMRKHSQAAEGTVQS